MARIFEARSPPKRGVNTTSWRCVVASRTTRPTWTHPLPLARTIRHDVSVDHGPLATLVMASGTRQIGSHVDSAEPECPLCLDAL
jgi:hypothetical protein